MTNGPKTPLPVVDWVKKLTEENTAFLSQLQDVTKAQAVALSKKDEAAYVDLYLKYEDLQREINDRQIVLDLLGSGDSRFSSQLYQAEFWNYLVAAETISNDLVNALVDKMHAAIVKELPTYESYEEFHAPYKHILIPGKIVAGRFDEIDGMVEEMNNYIQQVIPEYDRSKSLEVLPVAFGYSIAADTKNPPIQKALETRQFQWLLPEEQKRLLKEVIEQEAYVQDFREKNKLIARQKFEENLKEKA